MSDDLHPEHDLDPDVLAALDADLSSPAVWAEPAASLEDDIVAAIAAEMAAGPAAVAAPASTSRPRWLWAVAALAVLAAGFGLGAALTGATDPVEIAGDRFTFEPTALADGGGGTVELAALDNGLWIMLDLENMPPAPAGQFYEAWLIPPASGGAGGVVSAGTFHMRAETGSIVLWAGVTPDPDSIFSITLEDDDGDPSSSGRVVLRTEVGSLTSE
ncbi:MAG: anti-sigma factor [Actinomycetota bacterium]